MQDPDRNFNLPISEMSFPDPAVGSRIRHILARNQVRTLKDLLDHTASELLDMQQFGPICLAHVRAKLHSMGLQLKKEHTW